MTALLNPPRSISSILHGRWVVDQERSIVGFRVRHFGVAPVSGRFARFSGSLDDGQAFGIAETSSVETGQQIRDARLRSAEFFDAERFPRIVFIAQSGLGESLTGQLTIRDVTRPICLRLGTRSVHGGGSILQARETISRRAFGLDWPALREGGRLLVSDRVELRLQLVLVPA